VNVRSWAESQTGATEAAAIEIFTSLGQRRHSLTVASRRVGGSRYEDLRLAAAIRRLQGRCLVVMSSEKRAASRRLLVGADLDLQREVGELKRRPGRLTAITRSRAEARARRHFKELAAEIPIELGGTWRLGRTSWLAAARGRCSAITGQGTRCRNPLKEGTLCSVHARLVRNGAATPTPGRVRSAASDLLRRFPSLPTPNRRAVGVLGISTAVAMLLAWAAISFEEDGTVSEDTAREPLGSSPNALVAYPDLHRAADHAGVSVPGGGGHSSSGERRSASPAAHDGAPVYDDGALVAPAPAVPSGTSDGGATGAGADSNSAGDGPLTTAVEDVGDTVEGAGLPADPSEPTEDVTRKVDDQLPTEL
jgi:hypothetical protein